MRRRDYAEGVVSSVFKSFGYGKVLSPAFEHTELFRRKSGEEISEHMYVFEDKGKRSLCLRPEETASVCRMFVQDLRSRQLPLKLYYHCPMYRYEEPQKGRYREFWQTGVELIGSSRPESDAEVVMMACEALLKLGLEYTLNISHIGVLRGLLSEVGLDEVGQDKAISGIDKKGADGVGGLKGGDALRSILRLEGGAQAMKEAMRMLEGHEKPLTALEELRKVSVLLDSGKADYRVKLGMARGLEYYTGMIFEVRVAGLGAQDQVCGGGRYDNLIELFGGPKTPAVGFAFGFDRLLEAMEQQGACFPEKDLDVYVACASDAVRPDAQRIASDLRRGLEGRSVELELLGRKLGKALEHASNLKARYAVIVGPDELKNESVTLRNMDSGEQRMVRITDLAKLID